MGTFAYPSPTGEHDVDVTIDITGDGTVEVRVFDEALEIGAADIDLDTLVREATESSPPHTWLAEKLNELGLEWDGVSWGLRGSGADHAEVLHEYIRRLGWMPPDTWLDETVSLTCPDSPADETGEPHTIIGCGRTFTETRRDLADQGALGDMVDCPHCGICFDDPALKLPRIGG